MRTFPSRLLLTVGIAAAAVAMTGCNSMSAQECLATDWRTVGYEDGVNGRSGDRIGKYREACGEHGVTPSLDAYQAGRKRGLREFCQPVNGFHLGARGGGYNGVCPAELDAPFVDAYQSGRHLYSLRSRVGSTQDQIDAMRSELEQIDRSLVTIGAQMVDPATTKEQRAQLLVDTKHIAERKGEIKARIPQLERDLAVYQRELDDYRATLTYVE
jgi:Protein of unknown function (DUF2799)